MPLTEGPGLELTIAVAIAALVGAATSALTAALAALPDELLMAIRDEGGAEAATASRILAERPTIRARLLAGRTLAVAVVVAGVAAHAGQGAAEWVMPAAVALASLAYAALSEIAQTIARRRARVVALRLFRRSRPLELLFAPLAIPILAVSRLTESLLPSESAGQVPSHILDREVEHFIEKREEDGAISEEYAELLLRVLEFKDTVAREVMVPRTRMIAIDVSTPIDDVVHLINEEGHSRYPVYRERNDKIEGILYAKDLFRAIEKSGVRGTPPSLAALLHKPALFVAESQKIGTLLREMQARRQHLAVVVDEYGGTSGVVTLEDILEEIVGEIQDEHDEEEKLLTELGPGTYIADARISIYELGELIDAPGLEQLEGLEDGDFDSLGGLVVELAGRVPAVGEHLRVDGLDLIVREADEKHVTQVEIRKRDPSLPPLEIAPRSVAPPAGGEVSG